MFVVIRSDSYEKILTSLSDIERYAGIKILGKPRIMDPEVADTIVRELLGEVRRRYPVAAVARVEGEPAEVIRKISEIHPPAHLIVITPRHGDVYRGIARRFGKLEELRGYHSPKRRIEDDREKEGRETAR
ncbi:TPA: DUF356 domain-containing protein [Methanopyrus kandleri]|uniref:Uncharacterized protein conserved in archaea n=2 Tax=Methanopyrus kandleri TaxID=2320 RepID=Q8TY52_METKA|nr:Uncharacterized protein conserved in archaea [Methanopyrus kandleri AV19]HII70386.1 DUF356 domain-containing protein [Methanopyrus kandleri]